MTTQTTKTIKPKPRNPDLPASFITKTYQLLEDRQFPEIVDWNPEGSGIIIKKPLEFGQVVLPNYFKHNNLTSFVRQLNMYDFRKRRSQKYEHTYYHDLFQKGKRQLLKEIRRKGQENNLANIQKTIEALETVKSGQEQEAAGASYENHLLKKLTKDALSKIDVLENKVKELTTQNQTLWEQINHQTKKEDILVSFMSDLMKKKGISLDEFPSILNSQNDLSSLRGLEGLNQCKKEAVDYHLEKKQSSEKSSTFNIGDFFSFGGDRTHVKQEAPTYKDFNKRHYDDSEGLEEFKKLVKMRTDCTSMGSRDFLDIDRNTSEQDCWYIKQEELSKTTDMFFGGDSYANDNFDLLSFN